VDDYTVQLESGLPGLRVGVPRAYFSDCLEDEVGAAVENAIAGRPFDEVTVVRAAHAYEQASEWHERVPTL
jgi:Asp-tRNA(Asn)/Glu-tRNA(Gln) amidotransferase A subunit family amidase